MMVGTLAIGVQLDPLSLFLLKPGLPLGQYRIKLLHDVQDLVVQEFIVQS
jgi:hypothetical protein